MDMTLLVQEWMVRSCDIHMHELILAVNDLYLIFLKFYSNHWTQVHIHCTITDMTICVHEPIATSQKSRAFEQLL